MGIIVLIFRRQSHSHQNLFPILKFDIIHLLANLYTHGTLKSIQRTLRANQWGFLMLHIFKHIFIGPLFVWMDWMPSSECDHHWTRLSAHERLWASNERDWTRLMRLNTIEHSWVHVNAFEWRLKVIEHDWTSLSACERLWLSLNANECTLLLIPTSK